MPIPASELLEGGGRGARPDETEGPPRCTTGGPVPGRVTPVGRKAAGVRSKATAGLVVATCRGAPLGRQSGSLRVPSRAEPTEAQSDACLRKRASAVKLPLRFHHTGNGADRVLTSVAPIGRESQITRLGPHSSSIRTRTCSPDRAVSAADLIATLTAPRAVDRRAKMMPSRVTTHLPSSSITTMSSTARLAAPALRLPRHEKAMSDLPVDLSASRHNGYSPGWVRPSPECVYVPGSSRL
jgi:hypothetical protein